MIKRNYNKLGVITAILSFLIGTIVFGCYFFTSDGLFMFLGYFFILLAGLVNIIVIILITVSYQNLKKALRVIMLMLLNIPISIFYVWFSLILSSTERITIVNLTDTDIIDVNVFGCEKEHIKKIEANSSTTVWISISGDCEVNISYNAGGEIKTGNIIGYTTPGNGRITNYTIR